LWPWARHLKDYCLKRMWSVNPPSGELPGVQTLDPNLHKYTSQLIKVVVALYIVVIFCHSNITWIHIRHGKMYRIAIKCAPSPASRSPGCSLWRTSVTIVTRIMTLTWTPSPPWFDRLPSLSWFDRLPCLSWFDRLPCLNRFDRLHASASLTCSHASAGSTGCHASAGSTGSHVSAGPIGSHVSAGPIGSHASAGSIGSHASAGSTSCHASAG
jgi:hypothetical protein